MARRDLNELVVEGLLHHRAQQLVSPGIGCRRAGQLVPPPHDVGPTHVVEFPAAEIGASDPQPGVLAVEVDGGGRQRTVGSAVPSLDDDVDPLLDGDHGVLAGGLGDLLGLTHGRRGPPAVTDEPAFVGEPTLGVALVDKRRGGRVPLTVGADVAGLHVPAGQPTQIAEAPPPAGSSGHGSFPRVRGAPVRVSCCRAIYVR